MAFKPSVELPDDKDKAAKKFRELVMDMTLGIVTVMREDSADAFDKLSLQSENESFLVTTVWAKTPKSIEGAKTVMDLLPNGDKVSYEDFGHRVVSINKADKVSLVLSRTESQRNINLLRAFFCAAGEDVCGF